MSAEPYMFADTEVGAEFRRLQALEGAYDAASVGALARLDLGPSASCLEVGVGGGSMLRWMARAVQPGGRAVGVDIDDRFFAACDAPGIELRHQDVLSAPLEAAAFDVAHVRYLLVHLGDRAAEAVRRIVESLRPGGTLVAIEPDYAYPSRAVGAAAERLRRYFDIGMACLKGVGFDFTTGGAMADLFASCGLVDLETSIFVPGTTPGSAGAEHIAGSFEAAKRLFVSRGVMAEADLDALIADTRRGDIVATFPVVVTQGRRAA